ncbi:MAG: aromatic ring-hydroxylating dioxygenase subunit alpha [Sphingomonadales bacterium]|nr:aromatic ring-hydroxylating dioxygenase subunit alpha [Sphingomonadales bacterium]
MNTHARIPASDAALTALGKGPVPTAPYHDPAWFELEREAIFKRTWLQVGHVCELPEPNSYIAREIEVARASVIIARGKDGTIRAFHNACTHRGTQLVQGQCSGKGATFRCPYHMWTFGTDGRLLSAPDFESFHLANKAQADLRPVSVDVCAGLIFINLDPAPAQSLREFLGPMGEMAQTLPVAGATTFDEYVYEIDANWKVTFDNFQENYHLRFVHRRTNGAPPLDSTPNPYNYPECYYLFGPHRMNTSPGGAPPDDKPKPLAFYLLGKLAEQVKADGQAGGPHERDYFIFFPNLYLFGNPRMHFTHVVMPISANRSRGVFRFYWTGEDRTATEQLVREFSMAFAREIHTEDVEPLIAAQKGLDSGALEHVHFQRQEVMCRHLYEATVAAVRDWQAEQAGAAS